MTPPALCVDKHDVDPAPAHGQIRVVVELLAARREPVDELHRSGEVGEFDRAGQLFGAARPSGMQSAQTGVDGLLIEQF